MAVSDEYIDYVTGQLSTLGPVACRRMFGGVSLYLSGIIFGLIDNDTLYFKVADSNRDDYLAEDMGPFCPFGEGGSTMSYYQVPEAVIEAPDKLTVWAGKAVDVSLHAKRKPKRR